jgi:hypothetical protein
MQEDITYFTDIFIVITLHPWNPQLIRIHIAQILLQHA